jgi:Uma2 family endonuclease
MGEPRRTASSDGRRYVRSPVALFFPSGEEMPETRRHLELRTALFQIIRAAFGDRAVVGSEQFVFWDPTDPAKRCAPDIMVRVGEADAPFDSWKVWERGAPHLAVEVISAGDSGDRPWEAKLERYRQLGVRELVRFDPDDIEAPLKIWDGIDGDLVERDGAAEGSRRCDTLACFWCVRPHPVLGQSLRLARDIAGHDLYPTPEERIRDLEAELYRRDC